MENKKKWLNKEQADLIRSELEIIEKNVKALKEYADLFEERECSKKYFEEKMIERVDATASALKWISSNSKSILHSYISEENNDEEKNVDINFDTYIILRTELYSEKFEMHAYDSKKFRNARHFIELLWSYYTEVYPVDLDEDTDEPKTYKTFEEAFEASKRLGIEFPNGIEYEKKFFGCYEKNDEYEGNLKRKTE